MYLQKETVIFDNNYKFKTVIFIVMHRFRNEMSKPIQAESILTDLLSEFLSFIANDIRQNPTHIQPISAALYYRTQQLIADMHVDLDTPLNDKDE